jgi:hypothetical protein
MKIFFFQAFFRDVSTTSASGLFGTELDYRTDICRVTKRLTHRTFVTSSYKLTKHCTTKPCLSILAKSITISFQYNIESVYFFYSHPVFIVVNIHNNLTWVYFANKCTHLLKSRSKSAIK